MPDAVTIVANGAAVSHVGRVRANNQDSGYAGRALFVVADGMGGHAGGDVASSIAVGRIAEIDGADFTSPQEAEAALADALVAANELIAETVAVHPELTGMGTTCSAIVRVGGAIAVAHIGDSRIYLVRAGELSQITSDHTFVQRLVDTGRISPEEAAVHPRRSVLMRVLGDVDQAPEIDTSILGTVPGDRWLLCSDGLSGTVPPEDILAAVQHAPSADDAARALVAEALDHGAPDNVTAIVVEIAGPAEAGPAGPGTLVGAAASPAAASGVLRERHAGFAGLLRHPLRGPIAEASFEPDEDYLEQLLLEDRRRAWRRRITWLVAIALLVALAVLAGVAGWRYTQSQYFVGEFGGRVAVYQGVQASLGPIALSHVVERVDEPVSALQGNCRQLVAATINASSLTDARRIVANLGTNCGG